LTLTLIFQGQKCNSNRGTIAERLFDVKWTILHDGPTIVGWTELQIDPRVSCPKSVPTHQLQQGVVMEKVILLRSTLT